MLFSLLLTIAALAGSVAADLHHDTTLQVPLEREGGAAFLCKMFDGVAPELTRLPNSTDYEHEQARYWSFQQTELRPACRFHPQNDHHLRDAVEFATRENATIAVISGGHSANTGASNVEAGMTIDLGAFTSIALSDDKTSVTVGPAARWSDVYAALETHGVTVAGGRDGHVGVGGNVLGGGLNWYANQEGWACDSVTGFGVVTPDQQILWANSTSHPDLFRALKGSLGAFGVVFSIEMKTIPLIGFYGGGISYEEDALPALWAALERMTKSIDRPFSATSAYLSFAFNGTEGNWVYNTYLIDTANSSASPEIGNFLMIPNKGHTLRHMTPKESAAEIADSNPPGFRRSKFTFTVYPTRQVEQYIYDELVRFAEDMDFMHDELLGVTFQPLTIEHLRKQDNMFQGFLDAENGGPFLLVSVEMWWKYEARSEWYEYWFRDMWKGIKLGLMIRMWYGEDSLHPWVYPNYAARWQDPFNLELWEVEERRRLERVKERYDPDDVWERLVPGIWHFHGRED